MQPRAHRIWAQTSHKTLTHRLGLADRLRARRRKNEETGNKEDYSDRMTGIRVRGVEDALVGANTRDRIGALFGPSGQHSGEMSPMSGEMSPM